MALLKWKPIRDIDNFFEEDFPLLSLPTIPKLGWDLATDIYEKNGNIIAEMSLSGLNPEKIDIAVEGEYLKISGSREEEKEKEGKDYFSKEIKRGSFERSIQLPCEVKSDKAEATYHNGVLKIILPKKEPKDNEKIKVKVKTS